MAERTHLRQERVEAVLEVHLRLLHVRAGGRLLTAEDGPDGHAAEENGLACVVDRLLRLACLFRFDSLFATGRPASVIPFFSLGFVLI